VVSWWQHLAGRTAYLVIGGLVVLFVLSRLSPGADSAQAASQASLHANQTWLARARTLEVHEGAWRRQAEVSEAHLQGLRGVLDSLQLTSHDSSPVLVKLEDTCNRIVTTCELQARQLHQALELATTRADSAEQRLRLSDSTLAIAAKGCRIAFLHCPSWEHAFEVGGLLGALGTLILHR
jgi:hypothetical protein